MIKIIKEKCISCIACISACPHDCIRVDGLFVSFKDNGFCNNCDEKYCKVLCPTGAIILD